MHRVALPRRNARCCRPLCPKPAAAGADYVGDAKNELPRRPGERPPANLGPTWVHNGPNTGEDQAVSCTRRRGQPTRYKPQRNLQDHPAGVAHGAEERQRPTPVHRDTFDVLGAALHPGVRAVHGDVDARLVQKYEPIDRNPIDHSQECSSSCLDIGPIHFLRPAPVFLTT
jgi:hypothetical protein